MRHFLNPAVELIHYLLEIRPHELPNYMWYENFCQIRFLKILEKQRVKSDFENYSP